MKQYFPCYKICLIFFFFLSICSNTSYGQSVYQPYSFHFNQKLNKTLYHIDSSTHTAIKPVIFDSNLYSRYSDLMHVNYEEKESWIGRKLFNEHLLELNKDDYHFYADIIPDFQIGKEFSENNKKIWLNTRGFQVGGNIKNKFFFYSSAYENQGIFPEYINQFIIENQIVPGQMYGKLSSKEQDWTYSTAYLSYVLSDELSLSLAYDKDFIGDGYRSMLLSDISSNKTSLKGEITLNKLKILSIWSYMLDTKAERLHNRSASPRKYGSFQYLDYSINNRFSAGLFYSVLWGRKIDENHIIIRHEPPQSSMQIGLNSKYKILSNTAVYGQFILNNEWAGQLGLKGFDALGVNNLNFLAEYNFAKPYSYTDGNILNSYTNYSQSLAHPLGANFKETVGILNYSYNRFDFSFQGNYANYGLDPDNESNVGKNIFLPNNNKIGNSIGQGLKTDLYHANGKIAYLLNPKYNLRFELGGAFRYERNKKWTDKTTYITMGFRASFRNLYYDF